jgi:hypothetical protein
MTPMRWMRWMRWRMRPALAGLFALGALAALGAVGCDEQQGAPDEAAGAAECRKLEEHIVQITPRPGGGPAETDPARIQQIVAKLPVEDLEQCTAVLKGCKPGKECVIDCLRRATDPASLRGCIAARPE